MENRIDLDQLKELYDALSKAQSEIEGTKKGKVAGHGNWSYKYADLATVWDAIREPITKNGLSIIQMIHGVNTDNMLCVTRITHRSGGSIESQMPILFNEDKVSNKTTPIQALGSAITYTRRYSLMAMIGIAPEDDDGEAASATKGEIDEKKKKDFDEINEKIKNLDNDVKQLLNDSFPSRKDKITFCKDHKWDADEMRRVLSGDNGVAGDDYAKE